MQSEGELKMLGKVISDERAWRAADVGDSTCWTFYLPESCLHALDESICQLRLDPQPWTKVRVSQKQRAACHDVFKPVLTALNAGPGFAVIDRLPLQRYSLDEARMLYWMIGRLLGKPLQQDINGTLLYDVRDMGQDVTQGARFSVTNAESSFHTDNAFGKYIPDYVGLLCLQTARSGGLSQLVSAYTLHNELLKSHAQLLEVLYQPFYFDRRGEFTAGESPTLQNPVFRWAGERLTMRYLHYYIQVGHEKMGQPLRPDQIRALNLLLDLLQRKELMAEFSLQPGQLLFTNNRWLLHNRTAFEDYAEIEKRRHYARLWLEARATSKDKE